MDDLNILNKYSSHEHVLIGIEVLTWSLSSIYQTLLKFVQYM